MLVEITLTFIDTQYSSMKFMSKGYVRFSVHFKF